MRSDIRCDLHAQLRVGTAWHVVDALLLLVGAPPSALTGGVAIRLLLIIAHKTPSSAPDARGCTELLMHYRKFFALCRQAHADRIGSQRPNAFFCAALLGCTALRYAALPFDSIRFSCASAVPTLCAVLCGAVAQPWSAVAEKRTD